MDLAEGVLRGDRRSLSRLLTYVENHKEGVEETLRRLYPHAGRAKTIGVTGAPGAGKSTLVFALASEFRRRGVSVGVVAIDPSSPFTRGALLGDRVRMQELTSDSGVFIRSMATRGAMGGLAAGTIDAMMVLDAFGMDVVIVETVGAGQDEVDVVRAAQTVLVVEIPGAGDEVQALKAGILEIADIFVVNKADREGAEATVANLRQLVNLTPRNRRDRAIPVMKTVALRSEGVFSSLPWRSIILRNGCNGRARRPGCWTTLCARSDRGRWTPTQPPNSCSRQWTPRIPSLPWNSHLQPLVRVPPILRCPLLVTHVLCFS